MSMKKTYVEPMVEVLYVSTDSMIAVSGNFIEGETTTETVHDETIDGNNAWSRRGQPGIWGNE